MCQARAVTHAEVIGPRPEQATRARRRRGFRTGTGGRRPLRTAPAGAAATTQATRRDRRRPRRQCGDAVSAATDGLACLGVGESVTAHLPLLEPTGSRRRAVPFSSPRVLGVVECKKSLGPETISLWMRLDEHRAASNGCFGRTWRPCAGCAGLTRGSRPTARTCSRRSRWRSGPRCRLPRRRLRTTWLYRVAHNTAIGFATRRRRREKHEAPGEALDRLASGANPERSAIDTQQRSVSGPPCARWRCPTGNRHPASRGPFRRGHRSGDGLTAGSIATRLTRIRQQLAATIQKGQEP